LWLTTLQPEDSYFVQTPGTSGTLFVTMYSDGSWIRPIRSHHTLSTATPCELAKTKWLPLLLPYLECSNLILDVAHQPLSWLDCPNTESRLLRLHYSILAHWRLVISCLISDICRRKYVWQPRQAHLSSRARSSLLARFYYVVRSIPILDFMSDFPPVPPHIIRV
jgi:hypothetical protein